MDPFNGSEACGGGLENTYSPGIWRDDRRANQTPEGKHRHAWYILLDNLNIDAKEWLSRIGSGCA
jgi:hypothetical protein